jgi:hypothetical protein
VAGNLLTCGSVLCTSVEKFRERARERARERETERETERVTRGEGVCVCVYACACVHARSPQVCGTDKRLPPPRPLPPRSATCPPLFPPPKNVQHYF